MKNIICPVSPDRILEAQPRISALIVVLFLGLFLLTQLWIIPLFLVIDFFQRGFLKGKYSFVGAFSRYVSRNYFSDSQKIDKAPKVFAARLGFVFSSLVLMATIIGLGVVANILAALLVAFASIECFFNVCVGCYVYSWFILPRYS